MFVSSYNTFVQAPSSQKIDKQKDDKSTLSSGNFNSKLLKKTAELSLTTTVQAFTNNFNQNNLRTKQEILNQKNKNYTSTEQTLKKFKGQNTLLQVTSAYKNNSRIFSLARLPNATLNQTPSVDKTLPKEPREIKEANLRYKMVNTYIANDNYFKVTA